VLGFSTGTAKFVGSSFRGGNISPQIHYFHKSAPPQKWGLRDGNWKFISALGTREGAELYDLGADSEEKNNLAGQYSSRIEEYRNLVAQWYVRTEKDFRDHLDNYRAPGHKIAPGPHKISFGVLDASKKFVEKEVLLSNDRIAVQTINVPFPTDVTLNYLWIGPGGAEKEFDLLVRKEWTRVRAYNPVGFVYAPGKWNLEVKLGARVLASASFTVQPSKD
jgi:hypothetical protein